MNTLVRNAASNLSHRVDGYQPLDDDKNIDSGEECLGQYRTFSKRKAQTVVGSFSYSYRRERARKRQIFLRSYKLSSADNDWDQPKTRKSRKLRKMAVKVKSVVVSVVSFMRIGSLKSCNCRSAICAAAPISINKFC